MVDEIRGRPAPVPDPLSENGVPLRQAGDLARKLKDLRLDGRRLVGEWWGGSPGEDNRKVDSERRIFEELALGEDGDGEKAAAGTARNEKRPSDDRDAAEGGGTGAGAPAPSPFQLVGQLSGGIAAGNVSQAGPVDFSRHELAARVIEAAEALAVRVNPAAETNEVRLDFRDEVLPGTSAVIRREENGGKLTVAFTTSDSRVNLFLSNGNASLRGQLAERFGCEVSVLVEYRPQRQGGDRGDERGRRHEWWREEG